MRSDLNYMKIKPNIGILNALIRITIGLTVLSWSTAKLVKKTLLQFLLIDDDMWSDESC